MRVGLADGEIVAGHGRIGAAKLLGIETVPAVRLSHLSEVERRAYVIADNKLALNAGWDREMLAIELQGLVDLDFEVELTGFSLAEVDIVLDEARESATDRADASIDAARRADGTKQISPGEPSVAPDARTRAALGPDAGQRALLANAGFILKPDFDRPAGKLLRDCGARQLSEVFLKASCAARSLCGCTGRPDMLLKFSFFSSLPTLRSCR